MKFVAFLRGINVGGKNMIKMETLREMFGALGYKNVKSYINSGNIVFETAKADDLKLAEKIGKAIEKEFSMTIGVMVRAMAEIEDILKNNPFEGKFENDKQVHVLFLNEELSKEKTDLLLSNNNKDEQFAVRGREIFHNSKIHTIDSLLGKDYVGKKLKTTGTARNWRTMNKIAELLAD
jgi:uncharacterized protein (DUF1697 family)